MTTCTGCLHERNGRCALLPKQFTGAGQPIEVDKHGYYVGSVRENTPYWDWPPADERCGQFTTAEMREAAASELTNRVIGQAIDKLRAATESAG